MARPDRAITQFIVLPLMARSSRSMTTEGAGHDERRAGHDGRRAVRDERPAVHDERRAVRDERRAVRDDTGTS
jgi:hypothetical protein